MMNTHRAIYSEFLMFNDRPEAEGQYIHVISVTLFWIDCCYLVLAAMLCHRSLTVSGLLLWQHND